MFDGSPDNLTVTVQKSGSGFLGIQILFEKKKHKKERVLKILGVKPGATFTDLVPKSSGLKPTKPSYSAFKL